MGKYNVKLHFSTHVSVELEAKDEKKAIDEAMRLVDEDVLSEEIIMETLGVMSPSEELLINLDPIKELSEVEAI